jgi:hypothetical protein
LAITREVAIARVSDHLDEVIGESRDLPGYCMPALLPAGIGCRRVEGGRFLWTQVGEALRECVYSLISASG